jgi:hypothetical protein
VQKLKADPTPKALICNIVRGQNAQSIVVKKEAKSCLLEPPKGKVTENDTPSLELSDA